MGWDRMGGWDEVGQKCQRVFRALLLCPPLFYHYHPPLGLLLSFLDYLSQTSVPNPASRSRYVSLERGPPLKLVPGPDSTHLVWSEQHRTEENQLSFTELYT